MQEYIQIRREDCKHIQYLVNVATFITFQNLLRFVNNQLRNKLHT